jgi:hypothetical protein
MGMMRFGGGTAKGMVMLAAALLIAGCGGQQRRTAAMDDPGEVQPRSATYDCGRDGMLKVDNHRSRVVLTGSDGATMELPAAP